MPGQIEDEHRTSSGGRRRWLLGLEPIFEGGWLHRGQRARAWDVADRLVAVAAFGDVTVDLAEPKSAPALVTVDAYSILRDVDVVVGPHDQVELTGGGFHGELRNDVPPVPVEDRVRVVRIRAHTLLGDVRVRSPKPLG